MGPEFEKGDGRLRPSLQQRLPGAEGPPEGRSTAPRHAAYGGPIPRSPWEVLYSSCNIKHGYSHQPRPQSAFCVSPTTAGTIREHHRTPQVGSLSALQIMPNHPASPRTSHQPRGSQRRWSRLQSMGDADLWLAPPNLSAPNAYREYLSSTCGLNAAGNWQPEDTMKCWRHKTCPPEVLSRILSTPAAAFSSCSAQLRAHGCLAVPEQARCGDAPLPQHSHTQRPPLTCHPNNAVGERG